MNILWRHDVDVSVKSALAVARIEKDEGVKSTYFFLLNSEFYNILAPEILKQVKAIAAMGHHIGLHFDEAVLMEKSFSYETLSERLEYEKKILEQYVEVPIKTVSWHNPTEKCCLKMTDISYAGMVNAYAAEIHQKYRYVSDSNGIWRHETLSDVLQMSTKKNLHVLTHPVWWQETEMPPRARLWKTHWDWAKSTIYLNDAKIESYSRPNVRGLSSSIKFLQDCNLPLYEFVDHLWNAGCLDTLFIQLWKEQDKQIVVTCIKVLHKEWQVPIEEIHSLLKMLNQTEEIWNLFDTLFNESFEKIIGTASEDCQSWREIRQLLLQDYVDIPDTIIEEGCVWLSKNIQAMTLWTQEHAFGYDQDYFVSPTYFWTADKKLKYKSNEHEKSEVDFSGPALERWKNLKEALING